MLLALASIRTTQEQYKNSTTTVLEQHWNIDKVDQMSPLYDGPRHRVISCDAIQKCPYIVKVCCYDNLCHIWKGGCITTHFRCQGLNTDHLQLRSSALATQACQFSARLLYYFAWKFIVDIKLYFAEKCYNNGCYYRFRYPS